MIGSRAHCADPENEDEDEGRERYLVVVVVPWAAAMAVVTSWRSDERTGCRTYAVHSRRSDSMKTRST